MTNPKSNVFIENGETYTAVQIFGEGTDGNPALINVTGTGFDTYETGLESGGNHPDSAALGYVAVRGKNNPVIINKQTAVTIGGGVALDTMLAGFQITTAFTGNLVITGFADDAGVAASLTYVTPAIGWYEFKDVINNAGALTFTAANVADVLKCMVCWSTK